MKKKLCIAVLALFTIVGFGQTFKVSGKITEGSKPLAGANIILKGTTLGTTSDFNGNYSLQLEKGTHTLLFSFFSEPIEKVVVVNNDVTLNFEINETLHQLDAVLVSAVRVDADSPITHSNLNKEDLAARNLGQDIATQLNFLPGVVTTSDAGAGIGYTGFRVRGTSNQGINVTINGIPYNDAESATTFFVNLQDFTSSVESLQLQRGVGSTTNGPGAFGASLNILTDAIAQEANGSISNSFGSFGTRRHNVKFSTGLLNEHIEISGRLSQIKSDGYIDRASADLRSYFLQAAYQDDNTLIKAINFAGSEITTQSWFGIDAATLESDRTFNPAGARFDTEGNPDGFHNNQVDNYKQDHYQLHWNQKYDNHWSSNMSLNYTYGRGFFEEYIDDWFEQNVNFGNESTLAFYGLPNVTIGNETITNSDIIRRRWLDNDFYVASANVQYKDTGWDVISGAFVSRYNGDHFGEVIWARFASDSETGQNYYFGKGNKTEVSAFAKADFKINQHWSGYVDLQGRNITYETRGSNSDIQNFIVDESYTFFNPKAGISFTLDPKNQWYASYARANREPNRTDFENGDPRPEQLNDFELGWRYQADNVKLNVNGYYMGYRDQLVLTGALDNVGAPIRANSGESYRVGIEIDGAISLGNQLMLQPNLALSMNQNKDFFFRRDGELVNLGDTEISFSPSVVAGNVVTYKPVSNVQISLLSKYVGEQFMGNIESETSRLEAFFTNDLNVTYELTTVPLFKSIVLSGLVNNVFDVQYVSNGYFFTFDDDFSVPGEVTTVEGAGFYPQAGINFLIGATLHF